MGIGFNGAETNCDTAHILGNNNMLCVPFDMKGCNYR